MYKVAPLELYAVKKYCDKCGGEMKPLQYQYPTSPPKYPHKCEKCGHTETYMQTYPHTVYLQRGDYREPSNETEEKIVKDCIELDGGNNTI